MADILSQAEIDALLSTVVCDDDENETESKKETEYTTYGIIKRTIALMKLTLENEGDDDLIKVGYGLILRQLKGNEKRRKWF